MRRGAEESATDDEAAERFEAQVRKLPYYEHSDLPERTKAALRFGDLLSGDHRAMDEEFYAELRTHFDDDQILDLGMCIAFIGGWQRFIEAFGIVPDQWREGATLPWDLSGDSAAGTAGST